MILFLLLMFDDLCIELGLFIVVLLCGNDGMLIDDVVLLVCEIVVDMFEWVGGVLFMGFYVLLIDVFQ